jgi:hypothetical protein
LLIRVLEQRPAFFGQPFIDYIHITANLEKDAAESLSSTLGKYEPGKKEPRVGGVRGAPGVKRGLGGTSGPFCAAF